MLERKLIGIGLPVTMAALLFALAPALADEAQEHVQVKVEIYTNVSQVWGSKIISDCKPGMQVAISGDVLKAVRKALTDSGAKLMLAPNISIISNTQAQINIKTMLPTPPSQTGQPAGSMDVKTTIQVLPKVNPDKTITFSASATLPYVDSISIVIGSNVITQNATRYFNFSVTRCLADGESLLWTSTSLPSGAQMAVIFSPTIETEGPDQASERK